MAGVHQLPRREGPYHFLALLGASAVVFSVVGNPTNPPATNAWCALAGFLMWLLGVTRLLLLGQVGPRPLFRGALAAAADGDAAANPTVERQRPMHYFLSGRQDPEPEPATTSSV